MQIPVQPRPYWHVDAKWISGLITFAGMGITLLLFNLYLLTSEPVAVPALTLMLASLYSPEGLDEGGDIQSLLQKMADDPDGSYQPIPGLRIFVRASDIEGLTPRQARLFFFSQMTEPLYRKGPQGLAELATDPETRSSILDGAGLFGLVSAKTHAQLIIPLAVSAGVTGISLLLLVRFSFRFGRLFSPGCALLAASGPAALALGLLNYAIRHAPEPMVEEAGPSLGGIAASVIPELVPVVLRSYAWSAGVGLGLVVLGLVGGLVRRRREG
jgi:hypothetical protein